MSTGPRESTQDRAARFIAHLLALVERDDRGALAALRRSLQEPTGISMSACPYVVPFLPPVKDRNDGEFTERAFFLIGALFALHPEHKEGVSLGHAFQSINWRTVEGKKGADNPSVRSRFVALLDAHEDDIAEHLRHAVSLARANEVRLDWVLTLTHLLRWRRADRRVQRDLATDFWSNRLQTTEANPATTSLTNEGETPQ